MLKVAKIEYRIYSKKRRDVYFSYKDGRLFEGEHLIEGGLFKRTRERSSCFSEVYCIYQERSSRTKIKRREITHKKELWNYLPLLILL